MIYNTLYYTCMLGNNTKAFEYFGNSLTYDNKNPKTILAAGSIIQVEYSRVYVYAQVYIIYESWVYIAYVLYVYV